MCCKLYHSIVLIVYDQSTCMGMEVGVCINRHTVIDGTVFGRMWYHVKIWILNYWILVNDFNFIKY